MGQAGFVLLFCVVVFFSCNINLPSSQSRFCIYKFPI